MFVMRPWSAMKNPTQNRARRGNRLRVAVLAQQFAADEKKEPLADSKCRDLCEQVVGGG
jgi:hypothetical protein